MFAQDLNLRRTRLFTLSSTFAFVFFFCFSFFKVILCRAFINQIRRHDEWADSHKVTHIHTHMQMHTVTAALICDIWAEWYANAPSAEDRWKDCCARITVGNCSASMRMLTAPLLFSRRAFIVMYMRRSTLPSNWSRLPMQHRISVRQMQEEQQQHIVIIQNYQQIWLAAAMNRNLFMQHITRRQHSSKAVKTFK